MNMLGIPAGLFPAVVDPGTDLGPVLPDLASRVGLTGEPHVSAVASHDTASAVVAVPMAAESRRLHLLWHLGTGGSRADPPGGDRGRQVGQLHQ